MKLSLCKPLLLETGGRGKQLKYKENKTLERDQAYCAAFSEVPGSGKLNFLSEFLGFKTLAPQLPVSGQKKYILLRLQQVVQNVSYHVYLYIHQHHGAEIQETLH